MENSAERDKPTVTMALDDTRTCFFLDSLSKPSNKEVLYFAQLAREHNGRFEDLVVNTDSDQTRYMLVFSFPAVMAGRGEEFWNRAVMLQEADHV